ncbi:hypothetical protein OUZ56_027641 [Daphnia magna]|uniref:Uncharacterized protein n=1 Tax=Daphnia magna TaxID=35525 RepID=A0ABR0B1I0_9CRUS|nr:hypothetical protein OUZ56_027641 [Daphnia magna]
MASLHERDLRKTDKLRPKQNQFDCICRDSSEFIVVLFQIHIGEELRNGQCEGVSGGAFLPAVPLLRKEG